MHRRFPAYPRYNAPRRPRFTQPHKRARTPALARGCQPTRRPADRATGHG
jgi:hypothetical protein